MELVARKADLVRELQFFQQIVERKNTIPILANVLIETEGNAIKLLATDIEVTLSSQCEAAVEKPGGVTLPQNLEGNEAQGGLLAPQSGASAPRPARGSGSGKSRRR